MVLEYGICLLVICSADPQPDPENHDKGPQEHSGPQAALDGPARKGRKTLQNDLEPQATPKRGGHRAKLVVRLQGTRSSAEEDMARRDSFRPQMTDPEQFPGPVCGIPWPGQGIVNTDLGQTKNP